MWAKSPSVTPPTLGWLWGQEASSARRSLLGQDELPGVGGRVACSREPDAGWLQSTKRPRSVQPTAHSRPCRWFTRCCPQQPHTHPQADRAAGTLCTAGEEGEEGDAGTTCVPAPSITPLRHSETPSARCSGCSEKATGLPKFTDSLRVGSDLHPGLSDSGSSALSTQPHPRPSCQPQVGSRLPVPAGRSEAPSTLTGWRWVDT